MRLPRFTTNTGRFAIAGCTTVLLAVGAAACGGDESSGLSDAARRGKSVAASSGCASCHGPAGQGGVGPGWIDLAGSDREIKLDDGTTTVVADDDYLLRSIVDPAAEEVTGFNIKMPTNGLTNEQALDVVAYIKELTSDPQN